MTVHLLTKGYGGGGSESDFVPGVLAVAGTADALGEVLGRRRLLTGPSLLYVGLKGSFPTSCSDFSVVEGHVRSADPVLSRLPLVKEEGTVPGDFNHGHGVVVREVKEQRTALEEALSHRLLVSSSALWLSAIVYSPRFS